MNQKYAEWLEVAKSFNDPDTGLVVDRSEILPIAYEFQKDITVWALARGSAAIFADTGLGKSIMLFAWAQKVPGRVLIVAPLAVALQLEDMANNKLGIEATYLRKDDGITKLVITNYEMFDRFDATQFKGIVADESSIIKNHTGTIRNALIAWAQQVPFRLACTATPSPNDFTELGNTAEFLGIMRYSEMLSTFFINDVVHTAQWRLKKHAQVNFWKWVASWAVFLNSPADLGYPANDFELPPLNSEVIIVENNVDMAFKLGKLFVSQVKGLDERREARKTTTESRVQKCVDVIGDSKEPWIIWCDFNDESSLLAKRLPGAVEVRGSDDLDTKIDRLIGFAHNKYKILITKPKIAGAGLNLQNCRNMIFCGLSDSFERYYQAIRRCWRYGQTLPVNVFVIVSEAEQVVLSNVVRKEAQLKLIRNEVVQFTKQFVQENIHQKAKREIMEYKTDVTQGENWTAYKGDCIEMMAQIPDESIHYSVYSPPFASLYTYSNSDRDMGNCKNYDEFGEHFKFLVPELLRIIKPGRLVSMHCMLLPTAKYKDGVIGLRDFRGDLIRLMVEEGFIFHSEVCIWKDPVTAMQRTKALGLLHKQLKKDSSMSRQGLAEYLITFRKPGVNPEPIHHTADEFPVEAWQNYASPIWTDINPSDTLQYQSARDNNDERHICPLQLEVIRRALDLWTLPEETVFSPFMGIGSEGYVSLQKGRKFVGIELKDSYYNAAVNNLTKIENIRPYTMIEALNKDVDSAKVF